MPSVVRTRWTGDASGGRRKSGSAGRDQWTKPLVFCREAFGPWMFLGVRTVVDSGGSYESHSADAKSKP